MENIDGEVAQKICDWEGDQIDKKQSTDEWIVLTRGEEEVSKKIWDNFIIWMSYHPLCIRRKCRIYATKRSNKMNDRLNAYDIRAAIVSVNL